VNLDYSLQRRPGKVILLGGVQINMPGSMPDLFEPMMFEIRELGQPTISLLDQLICSAAITAGSVTAAEKARIAETVEMVPVATQRLLVPQQQRSQRQIMQRDATADDRHRAAGRNKKAPTSILQQPEILKSEICLNCGVSGHRTRNCMINVCGLCRQVGHTW
jgi:hypothetical protein